MSEQRTWAERGGARRELVGTRRRRDASAPRRADRRLTRQRRRQRQGISIDDVTIVVPTKNEAGNVRRFLRSIPHRVQLIVVDSSDDGTASIVRRERPARTTVVREDCDIPHARQLGSDLATTPWLLFSDADVLFSPSYAQHLAGLPITARTGGIVGSKGTAGGYERYHRGFARGQRLLSWIGIPPATGSNMLILKRALYGVGGFDLDLTVNEDSDAMFRVKRAGWQVRYEPALEVLGFDHRRLERGTLRKTAHSVARCGLLWVRPGSRTVRQSDWGYWEDAELASVPDVS
jgi:glycosyltransferase involved in cell wall biosynthesis